MQLPGILLRLRPVARTVLAALSILLPAQARAADSLIPVGVSRVDISPTNAVRLMGYAARAATPAPTNVAQRLHARAMAIGPGTNAVVVVTIDNCILPGALTAEIREAVFRRTGLATNRIALTVTHTHSAPCLTGAAPNIFARDISAEDQAEIDLYTRGFVAGVQQAILEALDRREPSRLSWGQGRVTFAKNRRTPGGPVDHALPVLRIADAAGRPRAVLANYACHCTTLGGEFNASHGDWAGVAAFELESASPGLTALVAIGCGADSNPDPRGTLALAEQHGRSLAAEAQRLLALPLEPLDTAPTVDNSTLAIPFQKHFTREEWEKRAATAGIVGHHARRWLQRLDKGEAPAPTLPYPVQTFAFGNRLAMVFLGGEVVVDYALRIKSELDPARLWVNAYANDVPCYIPSRRILREGGYEAESSLWYYDRPQQLDPAVEDLIVDEVRRQAGGRFDPPKPKGEMTPPKEARRALESFSLPPGLAIDLVAGDDLVQSPVAIDFDPDGSLWVCEMFDYPAGLTGDSQPAGRIKHLQDRDRDGRFDTARIVAGGLPFPTGIMAWDGGVLVCAAPDILWISADGSRKEVLFTGFATHNYQARVNGLRWGLDGWVYGSGGLFGGKIRSTRTGREIDATGRDFRFRPATGEFEALPGVGQQGRIRDDFGEWFGNDNGSLLWHYPLPPEAVALGIEPPQARVGINRDDNRVFPSSRTLARFNDPQTANHLTSACAPEVFRSAGLGGEFEGNAFVCEPVHNLVRRALLTPDGVTFAARRAPGDAASEFLSSTDNWFRPVEVRTGPDDALWVVDMYRFVVEHPRWIPPERLAGLDVRGGAERGRIYHIRPRATLPRPLPVLDPSDTAGLVGHLASGNGVERDMAHRLLLRSAGSAPAGKGVADLLRTRLRGETRAPVRAQFAAVLHGMGTLGADLEPLLDAREPRLTRFALGLAGEGDNAARMLTARIPSLGDDAGTRLHLAAALRRAGPGAAPALLKLHLEHPGEPWVAAATFSAVRAFPQAIADAALGLLKSVPDSAARLGPVLDRLVAANAPGPVSTWIEATDGALANDAALLAWLARLQAQPGYIDTLTPAARERVAGWQARLRPAAGDIARDAGRTVPERLAALTILGQGAATEPAALNELAALLEADLPPPLGPAVLARLGSVSSPAVPGRLLQGWDRLSPGRRSERIALLVSRPAWAGSLLGAVERGQIASTELTRAQQEGLRRHPDESVRTLAGKILAPAASDRPAVVERYREAIALAGVSGAGAAHFDRLCAQCHALRGHGHAVGPDISPFRGKEPLDFLVAVLDPNAAIDPRNAAYAVTTRDGRELTGIVTEETAASLVLVQPGGGRERILRTDVARLEASGRSLMPEGFEAELKPQDLADLFAWIRKTPGAFGGSQPDAVERARGAWVKAAPAPLENLRSSNDALPYPSWLGRLPLHYCRQTIGQDRMWWETTAPKGAGPVRLRWPGAMGFVSQPDGHFTLVLADQPLLDFRVTLADGEWRSADRRAVLRYQVEESNTEDSNGVLELELDRSLVPADGRLRFHVQASNSGSQRWFGLYALR